MSFKIVRNDITKMDTEAIVNTANKNTIVGAGCDTAVYNAAGYEELLSYRKERIGSVPEGESFITPGFRLKQKYIIHTVSPHFMDGTMGEEEKLRSCYRSSLRIAREHGVRSVAFPLISTGSFGYPKEEGMRIALDEIHAFLMNNDMEIVLVVFDEEGTRLGGKIWPGLEEYIDRNYVDVTMYAEGMYSTPDGMPSPQGGMMGQGMPSPGARNEAPYHAPLQSPGGIKPEKKERHGSIFKRKKKDTLSANRIEADFAVQETGAFDLEIERKLNERMKHLSDTFSQYLMYLIQSKKMENAEVYKRAIVDKKTFSKIKNNVDYHPQKLTALCLCMGACLNLDESRDLLARAGYALSPCDKTDIIFSYFIENEIYDMIELDIQLEEHGLPCIIE